MLARAAHAGPENSACTAFFRTRHDPMSFEAFARKSDCPQSDEAFYPFGDVARTHADEARSARSYGQCQRRLMQSYDLGGYVAAYPDLVAQEQALWAKNVGLDRRRALTPQQQLDVARGRIDAAFDNAAKSSARAGRIRDSAANAARERAATQQMFLRNRAMIADMQRQVQGMTPVVRADGTVSSVGREQERAAAAAAAQGTRKAPKVEASKAAAPATRTAAPGGARASGAIPQAAPAAPTAPATPELPPLLPRTYYFADTAFDRPEGAMSERSAWFQLPGDTSRASCKLIHKIDVPRIQSYCKLGGSEGYKAGQTVTVIAASDITHARQDWIARGAAANSLGFQAFGASGDIAEKVIAVHIARRR
jgi:hypothetical protein